LIKAERAIRLYGSTNVRALNLSPYWEDLVRLLQVFHSFKKNKSTNIQRLKRAMSVPLYDPYIDMKRLTAQARAAAEKPKQPLLI
jgi:thymidylate synthase